MRWTKSTYRKARRAHIARALDIKDQLDKNPTDDELLWAYYNTGIRHPANRDAGQAGEGIMDEGGVMLEYYDPKRQDDPTEHYECCVEDGEIWFGHGMICRYPELHPELKDYI